MFDSPEPAPPVKSGLPLRTMAARPPPSSAFRIFEMRCMRKSIDPSETRGSPGPNRPAYPRWACSSVTAFCCFFQSTPNGGFESP